MGRFITLALYHGCRHCQQKANARHGLLSFVGVNTPRFAKALQLVEHEYGSLQDYLLNQICLSEDDIAQLRDMFLEA